MTSQATSKQCQAAAIAGAMTSKSCAGSRLPPRQQLHVAPDASLADVLAQLRCPALILRGQRGEIRQETAERMLAVMPQARAQTIYGASHDVFLGPGSEQTLAAIQLFLFGLDGGDA